MAAEIDGELRIDSDECIFVGEWFTVWPKDSRRLENGVEVGSHQFTHGDRVHGAGGYLDVVSAGRMIDARTIPEMERCTVSGDEVAVLMLIE